jgi:hypothetical protein
MNGIHVAGNQNARLSLPWMRKPCADTSTKALAAGDKLNRGSRDGHVSRRKSKHPINRTRVPCRAFAFDPWAQALQHRFNVERK